LYDYKNKSVQKELHDQIEKGDLSSWRLPKGARALRISDSKNLKKVNFCNPAPFVGPVGPVGSGGNCDCSINFEQVSCNQVLVKAECTSPDGTVNFIPVAIHGSQEASCNIVMIDAIIHLLAM